jgi:hypothetical protein
MAHRISSGLSVVIAAVTAAKQLAFHACYAVTLGQLCRKAGDARRIKSQVVCSRVARVESYLTRRILSGGLAKSREDIL